mgnify:CR=1 FL=1
MQVKHKFRFVRGVFNNALFGFFNRFALRVAGTVGDALDMRIDGDKVVPFVIFEQA